MRNKFKKPMRLSVPAFSKYKRKVNYEKICKNAQTIYKYRFKFYKIKVLLPPGFITNQTQKFK